MQLDNLKTVEWIALQAGALLRERQPTAVRIVSTKDIVLQQDLDSEQIILGRLAVEFPTITFLSEEAGGERDLEGLKAIIDPLDATNNYYHKDVFYGVSIGIVEGGRPVLGVVYMPELRRLYSAMDITCSMLQKEGRPWDMIHVSACDDLKKARLSIDAGARQEKSIGVLKRALQETFLPQVQHCASGSAVSVAAGILDGYYHPKPTPFDVAAAGLIVQRAGGKVTDEEGNEWNPLSPSFVASNGLIHDQFLDLINR